MMIKSNVEEKFIKEVISSFDFKNANIRPIKTSGNVAYAIKTSKKEYFLRLSSSGQRGRSKNEIEAEIEFLKYLKKKHIPVSAPIKNKKGTSVISYNNHFGYIREFINGHDKQNPTNNEVRRFGELLGKFHNVIENFRTKNKRAHIFDIKTTRKHFIEDIPDIIKNGGSCKEKFIQLYKREINNLKLDKGLPKGTIHEDLGKRHVLWKGNEIVQMIDFDRSYYGPIILDLGQACRGWCFVDNWKKWSNSNFDSLLSGYSKYRKLNRHEQKSLIASIKFAVLERSLAFVLHYAYGERKKDEWSRGMDGLFKNLPAIVDNEKIINDIIRKIYERK